MSNISTSSPLLGDDKGRYRVHIVGNSGTGKSTTGAALAATLGLPYISMDKLFWNPDWKESSPEEFQARLRAALSQDERGWVVEGNYESKGGAIAMDQATDIIWLDPPLYVYFPRVLIRTILRLFRATETCAPGCDERLGEVLSKEGILWWCLSNHYGCRSINGTRYRLWGIDDGTSIGERRMRRFGGWGDDIRVWLKDVSDMVTSQKKI